jgi:hypothetical protein
LISVPFGTSSTRFAQCAERLGAEGQKALFIVDIPFAVYERGDGTEPKLTGARNHDRVPLPRHLCHERRGLVLPAAQLDPGLERGVSLRDVAVDRAELDRYGPLSLARVVRRGAEASGLVGRTPELAVFGELLAAAREGHTA